MQVDAYDIFAFVVIIMLMVIAVVAIVVIGSLPGKIAAHRKHPQSAAIQVAGWISLLTLGALWPIALIWAFGAPNPKAARQE